jgi:hypothetical protein
VGDYSDGASYLEIGCARSSHDHFNARPYIVSELRELLKKQAGIELILNSDPAAAHK